MLSQMWYVWLREWQYILRNRRLLLILIGVPLLYCILFGILYSKHVVNNINLGVLDMDNTSLSRAVITAFCDSDRFKYTTKLDNQKHMEVAMERGEIMAAIVIPPDFTRNIKRGTGSQVMVVVNGANMIIGNAVTTAASEIIQTLSAGTLLKRLEGSGLSSQAASKLIQPIVFRLRVWYNPTFNYTNFLLLGLMATVIQQVALLYMAVAMVREKEQGAWREITERYRSAFAVTVGKIMPYFLINLGTLNLLFAGGIYLFQVPFKGNYVNLLLLTLAFLACILSLGILLSTICRNELEATQVAMLVAVPSFLFSGYTWPLAAMPPLAKALARLLPLTYYADNVRKIFLMDVSLNTILPDLVVLASMAAILFLLATVVVKLRYFTPASHPESTELPHKAL
ncbi:ABC-2 type transport system permease protein [Thermanaeromonas toyohensis ToBE]|uniref:ABC-2 type transport system permease protein n=1 Tax=Thermanaeromonas toyohensis ToBE TaxID=698762 RepID=A0A1W1V9B1_9FIRM|nr:ABC transporter permease [Thermanaeromonas toyohensis]SMB89908.1 ABC-2 type transport system permease protein [Thermanaeromonas toyohensis ToBE]